MYGHYLAWTSRPLRHVGTPDRSVPTEMMLKYEYTSLTWLHLDDDGSTFEVSERSSVITTAVLEVTDYEQRLTRLTKETTNLT